MSEENEVSTLTTKEKRIAGLEKARQIKQEKLKSGELVLGKQKTSPQSIDVQSSIGEKEVWLATFTAAMRNLEIKSVVNISACLPIADKAVEIFNTRFPD